MFETSKFTNLQLELLRMFGRDLSEDQLLEIRSILSKYFADKISDKMDDLWEEQGWTEKTMEDWTKEHMRTPYKPSS